MTQTLADWSAAATAIAVPNRLLINGEHVDAVSGERFATVNPATGEVITEVALGDAADIDAAVNAARSVFEDGRWASLSPRDRGRVLITLAELIEAHTEELQLLETLDVGKPVRYSGRVDVAQAVNTYAWYGEAADKLYGEIAPTGPYALGMITKEPLGVVGAVTPWNFPMMMNSWKLAPALVAGNSVVLNPARRAIPTHCAAYRGARARSRHPTGGAERRPRIRRDSRTSPRFAPLRRWDHFHRLNRGGEALP